MTIDLRWLLAGAAVWLFHPAPAGALPQPLFASHDTLHVHIDAPLERMRSERDSDEYHAGTLRYLAADGSEQLLDVKLRARGKYRRQRRICPFPPVRLNFLKKQVAGTVFDGQDKLKLVTHCRSRSARYEQLLLREYAAYRLFQTLTDNSFSVRLLRITWNDSEGTPDPFEHYGFVIEDEDLLGERLGTQVSSTEYAFPSQLDTDQAALVGLFQYLIGNTDFSMLRGPEDEDCCHNVTLFDHGHSFMPIPYDFDFSGIVNAPYAKPNPRYKIRSVQTRLYLGRCQHNGNLPATLQRFRDARPEMAAIVESIEGLEGRTRKSLSAYIRRFFEAVESPDDVEKRLVRECV